MVGKLRAMLIATSRISWGVLILLSLLAAGPAAAEVAWPAQTRLCRPWAYNWWLGSAVDKANLSPRKIGTGAFFATTCWP